MPIGPLTRVTSHTRAKASDWNGNCQTIEDKFNASIVDADISPTANLQGTKLLDGSLPGTKLQDGAITNAKLGQSPTVDSARSVTADCIKDGAITSRTLAAGAVTAAKLDSTAAVITTPTQLAGAVVKQGKLSLNSATISFPALFPGSFTAQDTTLVVTTSGAPVVFEIRTFGTPVLNRMPILSIARDTVNGKFFLVGQNPYGQNTDPVTVTVFAIAVT